MWCHLPTGISRRRLLQFVAVASLFIAFFTTLVFAHVTRAAEGVNQTLAFQGRLAQSSGALVPDGHYNIQFKIYQDGPGTAAGNPGGSLKWTETYINNGGTSGVEVKNGYFSVALGSLNPFGSQVDWNQDTVWLSMNVAGSATDCTAFGSGTCAADGEMLPMKRMTATPFALNSAQLGGKAAENFIQLAQGVQEDASTNSASIAINRTGGSGDFLQLQRAGDNALRINDGGDIVFGNLSDHLITTTTSASGTDGTAVQVRAGNGGSGSGSAGGNLILQGGDAGGTNGGGGNVAIDAGGATGTGSDGYIGIGTTHASSIVIGSTYRSIQQNIVIGGNETAGSSTFVAIGSGAGAAGGATRVQAKDVVALTTNGVDRAIFGANSTLYLGNGSESSGPSDFKIQGTDSSANGVSGGDLIIQGGNAKTGDASGGNLTLNAGASSGAGAQGSVQVGSQSTGNVTIGSTTEASAQQINIGTNSTTGSSSAVTLGSNSGTSSTLIQGGSGGITINHSGATAASFAKTKLQVGDGVANATTTLLTLDQASSSPGTGAAMLGSMYYDTTLGKVQCYEADGWGACGAAPDTFIVLSPEYPGTTIIPASSTSVTNNFCSDTLNINDGSSGQPSVCGTNETYNYYRYTTSGSATATMYVNYQLPGTFKQFVSGTTTLLGKTDNAAISITYQVYRNTTSGLVTCGSPVTVSSGVKTSFQQGTASGSADPASCGFTAGESIIFKITLQANLNQNSYLSNLRFAYSST